MIIIPISFGTVILHNETTHLASKSLMPANKADSKLIMLPNGQWFDPHGTGNAPVTPGKLKASITLNCASEAALSTAVLTIFDSIGSRKTLTVKLLDNSTKTCLARLEEVDLVHPFHLVAGGKTKMDLTFQCITEFD
jgi:hypothetical protein